MFFTILVIFSVKSRWHSEGMDAPVSHIATDINILNGQIPVLQVIHFANKSCSSNGVGMPLGSSLYQAALYNDKVYVLTNCANLKEAISKYQNENNPIWNRVTALLSDPYENTDQIQRYKSMYLARRKDNDPKLESIWSFELICIVRWMILYNFMVEHRINKIGFTDRDALLYLNLTKFVTDTEMDTGLLINPPRVAGSFAIFSRESLRQHITTIFDEIGKERLARHPLNDMALFRDHYFYARISELKRMNKAFDFNNECWGSSDKSYCLKMKTLIDSGISTISKEKLIVPRSLSKVFHFRKPIFHSNYKSSIVEKIYDEKYNTTFLYSRYFGEFDNNYSGDPNIWVQNGKYKQLVWINHYPYVQRKDTPYLIAALGLHFQGSKKSLIRSFEQKQLPDMSNKPCVCVVDVEKKKFCDSCR
jgi:hypothetical protein